MTRFQALALLSTLCAHQVEAFSLRSLVENPFLPVHRRLGSCPTTSGVDYIGNDIKSVSNVQVSDCCSLCYQTQGCGAFTWTNHASGTCWLKSAKGNTATNSGATSAVLVGYSGCSIADGVDYQGNDIANVPSNNAGGCCSICSAWLGCNAFSWSDHKGGTCWLKSGKGAVANTSGVKSAEVTNRCILQSDVDFIGNDLTNVAGTSGGECCGICNNWSGCRSFTWSNLNGGTCWLKSSKGQSVAKSGVVSCQFLPNPQPSCTLENNVDYEGNDVANVPGGNAGDCCDKCRANNNCRAFSWSNLNGGTCWLKSGKTSTASKSGVTSAVVF